MNNKPILYKHIIKEITKISNLLKDYLPYLSKLFYNLLLSILEDNITLLKRRLYNNSEWNTVIYNFKNDLTNLQIYLNILSEDVIKQIFLIHKGVFVSKLHYAHALKELNILVYYYSSHNDSDLLDYLLKWLISRLSIILLIYYEKPVTILVVKLRYSYSDPIVINQFIKEVVIGSIKDNILIRLNQFLIYLNQIIPLVLITLNSLSRILKNDTLLTNENVISILNIKYKFIQGINIKIKGKLSSSNMRKEEVIYLIGLFKDRLFRDNNYYSNNVIKDHHHSSKSNELGKDGIVNIYINMNNI